MTTETTQETTTQATTETAPQPSPSPTESKAREQGWVSKEEWIQQGKAEDEWRSAREYVERGELFEKIHSLQDETKKTNKAFKALVEHHKKVKETAKAEALAALRAEKKAAMQEHDIERVFQIDEKIEKVRDEPVDIPEVEVPPAPQEPTATFRKWHKQNSWYELDGSNDASEYANSIGLEIRRKNPDLSEAEFLDKVSSKVLKLFPDVFKRQDTPPEVKGGKRDHPKTEDPYKPTETEAEMAKMFVAQGAFKTVEEYYKELRSTK